jgi:hypothetical protein
VVCFAALAGATAPEAMRADDATMVIAALMIFRKFTTAPLLVSLKPTDFKSLVTK